MAKNTFEPSVKLAQAQSLVLEQNHSDWGAKHHLNMLRYLVLACSDKAGTPVAEVGKLTSITVDWQKLKAEFTQSGKLAECANYKKYLQELGEVPLKPKSEFELA
jgi:hypothetical protein